MDSGLGVVTADGEEEEEEEERDSFGLAEKACTVGVVQGEGNPTTRIATTVNQRPPRVACPMIWLIVPSESSRQ